MAYNNLAEKNIPGLQKVLGQKHISYFGGKGEIFRGREVLRVGVCPGNYGYTERGEKCDVKGCTRKGNMACHFAKNDSFYVCFGCYNANKLEDIKVDGRRKFTLDKNLHVKVSDI